MKKIYTLRKILSKKEMLNLYFILFLMIVNSFLEAFSIGLLIPLLSLLFENSSSNQISEFFYSFFNTQPSINFFLFLLSIIFFLKYSFTIFFTKVQTQFILNLKAELSARFFEIMPKPLLTRDQLKLLRYDNISSGKYKTNFDIGIPSLKYFDQEVKKYCYMWRDGGQFSTEKYSSKN